MKHFLSIADLSPEELADLLDLAQQLKAEWKSGGNKPILQGKSLAMLFMKPSLRTRVSFEMAMVHLGGYALYLGPSEVKMGQRESVPDVARVLSGYVDGIMARTFDHEHVTDLAKYASIPVINGLSEYNHPAQALADVLTIIENRGSLEGLTVTYIGDGNNVTRSLMFAAVKLGANFRIATPAGYNITEEDHDLADKMNHKGVSIEAFEDPQAAVEGCDVIYTDVWTSMGQEEETAKRMKVFPPYQINEALVGRAKKDALVMHCLPAHRGEEITDAVADGAQSVLFPQAHNRLHAQKAVLARLLGGA